MAKKIKQYSGWIVAAVFGVMLLADEEEKPVLDTPTKSLTTLQQEPTPTELDQLKVKNDEPLELQLVTPPIKNTKSKQITPIVAPIIKTKPSKVLELKPVKLVGSVPKQSESINNSPAGYKYISKKSVNIRAKPTTNSAKVGNLKLGTKVPYFSSDNNWFQIEMPKTNRVGWIRGDLLADNKPKPMLFVPVVAKSPKQSGPIRAPYYGTCDCPYDRTKNGGRCGGRSAYSRPGGRSPKCYF